MNCRVTSIHRTSEVAALFLETDWYTANMGETLLLERPAVVQRGKRLEYFTIAWNAAEGLIATAAGLIAGSISLVGFGIDSFIELTSGSVLLWRLSVDADEQRRASHEKRALRFVGACFLMLASYVAFESAMNLLTRRAPEHSSAGRDLVSGIFVFGHSLQTSGGPLTRGIRSCWKIFPQDNCELQRRCRAIHFHANVQNDEPDAPTRDDCRLIRRLPGING